MSYLTHFFMRDTRMSDHCPEVVNNLRLGMLTERHSLVTRRTDSLMTMN